MHAGTIAAIKKQGGRTALFPALPVSMDRDGRVRRTQLGYTLSRLLVALDKTVECVLVRDVDGRLNGRERLAVEAWLRSSHPLHILRDHPGHCHGPLMPGLIGLRLTPPLRTYLIESLQSWSAQYSPESRFQATFEHGNDRDFLVAYLWPHVDHLAHDSYCCEMSWDKYKVKARGVQAANASRSNSVQPFPVERIDYEHCGQVFSYIEGGGVGGGEGSQDQGESALAVHVEQLAGHVSPLRCRGHPDWEYG